MFGTLLCLFLAGACSPPDGRGAAASSASDAAPRAVVDACRLAAADERLAHLLEPTADGFAPDGESWTSPGWRAADGKRFDGLGARLPARADGVFAIGVSRVARYEVSIELAGADGVALRAHDGRVVYAGAFPSTDVLFAAALQRVEEFLLLRDDSAPRTFAWKLRLPTGLLHVRSEPSGGLAFQDARGETVLRVPPPFALDAVGSRRAARLAWSSAGEGRGRMEVSFDSTGLTFPVLLDPAIEIAVWHELPGYVSARSWPKMAFDTARGKAVLFGGELADGTSVSGDTFEFDGLRWTRREPAHRPPARTYHALAYDSRRQRTVLFGGDTTPAGGTATDDTWEWDGADWTQRSPTTRPPARGGHALAYDSARGVTVLFGGSLPTMLDDTWEWDGTNWTERKPSTSPPAQGSFGMAYDSTRAKTVLAGQAGTWEWDGIDWVNKQPFDNPNPVDIAQLAYDSDRRRTVLAADVYEGVWEWDGVDWTQKFDPDAPCCDPLCQFGCEWPSLRYGHAITYDAAAHKTLLFGGADNYFDYYDDTWTWDGVTWASAGVQQPQEQGDLALAFDASRAQTVLYGSGETWVLTGSDWQNKTPLPAATRPSSFSGGAMAFDDASGNVLLFGGDKTDALWTWNGAAWTDASPAKRPPGRSSTGLVVDTIRHRAVLFGGDGAAGILGDTWEWNGSSWADVSAASGPPSRKYHGLAFDAKRGRTVLFGGQGASSLLNDTWEWDGAVWSLRAPTSSPSPRFGMSLAFDAARGRTFLFGGADAQKTLGDTWEWDGVVWREEAPTEAPAPRMKHAMAFDPVLGRAVLFGGSDRFDTYKLGDLWEYRTRGGACSVGDDCDTGSCVDGVCCEETSCGTCQACNTAASPGRCAVVTNAEDDTCKKPKTCNGAGVCLLALGQPAQTGTLCASGLVADGVCCSAAKCLPCQACDTPASPGTCAALTNVVDPDSCADTKRCDASGDCRLADAQPCQSSSECASAACADGVCCDKTCAGPCVACSAAKKGPPGKDGVCEVAGEGENPRGQCSDRGPASCGADGTCDGHGACRQYAPGTACHGDTCTPGQSQGHAVVGPKECDGFGACIPKSAAQQDCGLYGCTPLLTACLTTCATSADCISTARCVGGACQPRAPEADPCTSDDECVSGHCADGYCCDRACSGQCEACDDPKGTCTLVSGDPHPPRTACKGIDPTCRGTCNGDPSACKYESADVSCGTNACVDGNAMAFVCNGAGDCEQHTDESCVKFACADGACKHTCSSDGDCAPFYKCDAGDCVPIPARCDGDHTLLAPDGTKQDCAPYRCTPEGATCLVSCGSKVDCVAGMGCTTTGTCAPPAPASPDTQGGCSVVAPRSARPHAFALIQLFALLGLARVRRRSRALAWAKVCALSMAMASCAGRGAPKPDSSHVRNGAATAEQIAALDPATAAALASDADGWTRQSDVFVSAAGRALTAPQFDGIAARLPSSAARELSVGLGRVERFRLRMTLEDAADVPAVSDHGRVVYPLAYPSTDVLFTTHTARTEEWLLLSDSSAPTRFVWRIGFPSGIVDVQRWGSLEGALAFVDRRGDPVLFVAEPFAIDATGTRRGARLEWQPSRDGEPRGGRLSVALDPRGLTYPVLLDPAIESAVWQKEALLEPRSFFGMAFDSGRSRVVLFGGGYFLDDTREWDGSAWRLRAPAHSPAPRYGAPLAYDGKRAVTVLFGGTDGSSQTNETWVWDGTDWSERAPAHRPPGRVGGSMAYDSVRERVVLFGGSGLADTWEWDGADWTERTPPSGSPTPQDIGPLAFDAAHASVILFASSGTWQWDGGAWAHPSPAHQPSVTSPGLAFDPLRGKVVLFGGAASGATVVIWEWDGTDWTHADPPVSPKKQGGALAFDGHGTLLLRNAGDTWRWDGAAWSLRAPAQAPPRQANPIAFDSARKRTVLFDTDPSGSSSNSQTWEWDGAAWSLRAEGQGPAVTSGQAVAFDESHGETVLFGGYLTGGPSYAYSNETWTWDGSQWTKKTPARPPPARSHAAMTFDAVRGRIVLFGGETPGQPGVDPGVVADTWEWDGATWAEKTTTRAPAARHSSAMAFDAARGRSVLFGGTPSYFGNGANYSVLDDTWEWDGAAWAQASPGAKPPGRYGPGLAFDPVRRKTVLCGGGGANGPALGVWDTWEWDGTAWVPMATPGNTPPGRAYVGLANEGGRTVLFGGDPHDGFDTYGDTWTYYTHAGSCTLGSECDTGSCVDGICCDQTACGVCEGCNTAASPGTCAPVVSDRDPDTCSGTKSCSGAGQCLAVPGQSCAKGAECASGFCVDGVCCGTAECGTCEACNTAGSPGTCAGITSAKDPPTCAGNDRCDAVGRCALDDGQPCTAGSASKCASGRCVDGVCCDVDCSGPCVACSAQAKGQGPDGVCGVVLTGTDFSGDCTADAPSTCGLDGTCDGKGACRTYPINTRCGSTTCANGSNGAHSKWASKACDGVGHCLDVTDQDCGLARCDAASTFCPASCTDSSECIGTARCVGSVCGARSNAGVACASNDECLTRYCTDGVCCLERCDGRCQACDATGVCGPVTGAPRGPRPACEALDPACGGTCDGKHVDDCVYPDVTAQCGESSCVDGSGHQAHCDGKGSCGPTTTMPCAPFACGAVACETKCADDSDCDTQFRCDVANETCVGASGLCDGDHRLLGKDGAVVDCAPYKCTPANVCLTACGSKLDCANETSCSATGTCGGADLPAPSSGCSLTGRSPCGAASASMPGWAALAMAVVVARRRRKKSPIEGRLEP